MKYEQFQDEKLVIESHIIHQSYLSKKQFQTTSQPIQSHTNFNKYKIPPDWSIAEKHWLATSVGREIENPNGIQEICDCCGFEIDREKLSMCCSIQDLGFLGAGFSLFYNFIKWCGIILLFLLAINIYALYTNFNGNFCKNSTKTVKTTHKTTSHNTHKCYLNWISMFTLVNKLDNPKSLKIQEYLNLTTCIVVMILLMGFRYKQREIACSIDELHTSPSDYTIMVSKIPLNLSNKINYEDEMRYLFTNCFEKPIKIEKISLVYNIELLEEKEEEIRREVDMKKQLFYKNPFEIAQKIAHDFDEKIEKMEEDYQRIQEMIKTEPKYFAGIAFLSFSSEEDKEYVLENCETSIFKKIKAFFTCESKIQPHSGFVVNSHGLFYKGYKLQIEEAPEPKDIDWEFIHISKKIRRKSVWITYLQTVILLFVIFIVIAGMTFLQTYYKHKSAHHSEGKRNIIIALFSIGISVVIVLFNKLCLGFIMHKITDKEKLETRSEFNISFATKYAIGLFFNTALVSFVIEILVFHNYYDTGGLIFTEHWVFIMNACIPQMFWILDPWWLIQKYKQKKEKKKNEQCILTQKEANL